MSIVLKLPSPPEGSKPIYPLDKPSLSKQLEFFKSKTGIEDTERLKLHLCEIQEKIYQLFPFPCVWNFDFVRGKVVNNPLYQDVVQSAKKQTVEQKIFVDFGANVPHNFSMHKLNPKKKIRPYAAEAHWYGHSAESWKSVWEKLFDPSTVKIVTEIRESDDETQYEYIHGKRKVMWLYWSVTRI
ncbi:hypothetical protein PSHT_01725 [Puccinia striiformis]|uniref:Uncharacterized protein n=1 Tax=Puccinia striiformis TaxID=27350 RepID=A0A2S4WJQ2_9BASI|nr:hypothetical protein PSHT_01725 [Puccinia striiformis]